MNKSFDVGIRITADGRVLVTEARSAKDALNQLGESTRKVSNDTATLTNQTAAQTASLASMKTGLIAAAGAYVSLGAAIAGGKAIIDAALANERLNNTLKVATGSAEAAAREMQFLRQESDKLGLQFATTADQYAKLAAASKGTALEGQATRDIFLGVSKAASVLGLSAAEAGGALTAIQQIISKGKVSAEELRGQLGERLPGAFQIAARAIGVTTAELDDMLVKGNLTAERLLPALATELEKTFGAQAQEAAQGLNAKINRLDNSFTDLKTAIGNTGLLDLLSSGIVLATRFVDALSGAKVLSAVDAQKQKIAEMRAELESMANRRHIPLIGDLLFDKKQADLLSQRIEDGVADLARLETAAQQAAKAADTAGAQGLRPGAKPGLPKEWTDAAEKQAKAAEKAAQKAAADRDREAKQALESSQRIIEAYKRETAEIGLNTIQKKMMSAAAEAAKAPTEELRREIMASAQAWALATRQEEENLAIKKRQADAADELARRERQAAEQTQRYWSGIWGDVEQTARMAFVQFAAHGKTAIESIGETLKVALIDVLYQLTVRKWMINIGASIGLGGSGMAGDVAGGGMSLLNAASLGSGALNLLKGGFGATSLIGGWLSKLGSFFGSSGLSAFGGGFAGDAIGGLAAGGFSSGAASAASLGASVASFAGPAIAIAAVDQITRMLAGDKMIGGGVGKVLNYVPVLGPLLNGLFGRGPMKQQGTLLSGEIGAEGFESGYLQTRFKAKGGLFRSDKIDYARVDAMTGETWTDNKKLQGFADDLAETAREVFGLINDTTKQTSASLRQIGQDLGISTDGIDKFGYSINLLSEKGKMLTEEQIGQEIEKITDGLARSLIPQVDELAKRGETALQTVARLGSEFTSLIDAAALVLGKSAADAKSFLSGSTYQGRAGFVEAAGGLDAFNQKVAFFADNFLTQAERLVPVQGKVNDELKRLGLSTDLTRDQFRGLVQSFGQINGISEETLQALLTLAPAFAQVRTESKALAEDQVGAAFAGLQKAVEAEKNAIAQKYNDALKTVNGRIEDVTQSVGKLRTLSEALKSTVDQIRPLGRDQAKQQIRDAIAAASAGNVVELDSVRAALGVIGNSQTIGGFSGSFEFAREQAKSANLVANLGRITDDQLTLEERSLAALEAQRDRLTAGFEAETARLDGLLTQGQQQIEALSGINAGITSLAAAIGRFNAASYAAGGGSISGGSLGNPDISNQQIIDYFKTPRTPDEIARDAGKYGVTSQQIIATGRFTQAEADKFFTDNPNIPRFAKGGFHRGGLRIVGENGPELEMTGPASIASNNDLSKLLNNKELVDQLKVLIDALAENTEFNRRVSNKLDAATTIVNGQIGIRTGTS